MRWDEFLTEYPTFFLSHDKKDRFTEFGKSSLDERFVFLWGNPPPLAQNPHTSILCITSKCIKNESTTTNPTLNIFVRSRKCSQNMPKRKRKKPQL